MTIFPSLTPLEDAWRWIDAHPPIPPAPIPLSAAGGTILAEPVSPPPSPTPPSARNGYAVRAADCDGASPYNPLPLTLLPPGQTPLPPAAATPIASGHPLPEGADAVLPIDSAETLTPTTLDVIAPIAPGDGVERWRTALPTPVLAPGTRLSPPDLALLALCGLDQIQARRPCVALVIPGPKAGPDALTPMLTAALHRDGVTPLSATLRHLPACDAILVAGRSGLGPDDDVPAAIAGLGGSLAHHGIALRPGHTAGLGTLAGTPLILLPGDPLACLTAYTMLARRLLRRLAADRTDPPTQAAILERKIASELGLAELVPVRLAGDRATPLTADLGLLAATGADAYVLVPADSEGHPALSRVAVCMDFCR